MNYNNNKRKVIEGQFEDPVDEIMIPKRSRETSPSVFATTTTILPDSMTSSYDKPTVKEILESTSPLTIMVKEPNNNKLMQQRQQPTNQHEIQTIDWRHLTTAPLIQTIPQVQGGGKTILVPPPFYFVPTTNNNMTLPLLFVSTASSLDQAQKMMNYGDDKNEWQIPYSHNYHPKIGFINNNKSIKNPVVDSPIIEEEKQGKNQKSDDNNTEMSVSAKKISIHSKKEQTLVTDNNLPSLNSPEKETNNQKKETIYKAQENQSIILEDTSIQFGITDSEITKKDVLCGRGGLTNTHPGNIRYRKVVEEQKCNYGTSPKSKKRDIAIGIVQRIRQEHGRFLKRRNSDKIWYEIGDKMALDKTSQTLREGLAKLYRENFKKMSNFLPSSAAVPNNTETQTVSSK